MPLQFAAGGPKVEARATQHEWIDQPLARALYVFDHVGLARSPEQVASVWEKFRFRCGLALWSVFIAEWNWHGGRAPNYLKLGKIGSREVIERIRLDEGIAAVIFLRFDIDAGDYEARLHEATACASCSTKNIDGSHRWTRFRRAKSSALDGTVPRFHVRPRMALNAVPIEILKARAI